MGNFLCGYQLSIQSPDGSQENKEHIFINFKDMLCIPIDNFFFLSSCLREQFSPMSLSLTLLLPGWFLGME